MADAIVADCATPPQEDRLVAMTPERQSLALEASWELQMLSITMARELNRVGRDQDDPLKYRPFAARIYDLSGALISALDDQGHETLGELRRRVRVCD